MAAQLPSEAIGSAVGILIYSLFCLFLSLLLLWLVWVHHERRSYVAMLSFSMSLGTLASIIQQIHTIACWNHVKTSQYENVLANAGKPELNINGASTGLDLVLFYIQYYTYNVDAMLVVFWSVELANSILQLRNSRLNRLRGSLWAKASAIILPIVQVCLLRTNVVQRSVFGYMVLADFIMIISFGIGSLLLLAILIKYIHSRAALVSWNVRYGQHSSKTTNPYSGSGNLTPGHKSGLPRRNIYDSWLAVRFTVAFVALGLFELVVIFFQLRAANTNTKDNIPPKPDLSAARARGDFALFLPGVSASLLIFIVFGTTRTFREYVWTRFAPRFLQDRVAARKALKKKKTPPNNEGGDDTMAPPVILSTFAIAVRRNSNHDPANPTTSAGAGAGADFYKGAQTFTTINGHKYRTGQHTNYIHSVTPSPTASPGPGSEVDLEIGGGGNGQHHGGYGGDDKSRRGSCDEGNGGKYLQTSTTTTTTPYGVVRSTSRTDDDDVPILKKAMPSFQRGYR